MAPPRPSFTLTSDPLPLAGAAPSRPSSQALQQKAACSRGLSPSWVGKPQDETGAARTSWFKQPPPSLQITAHPPPPASSALSRSRRMAAWPAPTSTSTRVPGWAWRWTWAYMQRLRCHQLAAESAPAKLRSVTPTLLKLMRALCFTVVSLRAVGLDEDLLQGELTVIGIGAIGRSLHAGHDGAHVVWPVPDGVGRSGACSSTPVTWAGAGQQPRGSRSGRSRCGSAAPGLRARPGTRR